MLQRRRSVPYVVHSNTANQVSTAKFKVLCYHLRHGTYRVRAKVDGAHVKIGKTEAGQVFFSSARSTTPYFASDLTPHTDYSPSERSAIYDQIMHEIFGCDFVNQIPIDTTIHFELLHPLLGSETAHTITFVTLPYPKTELGEKFTLVPLRAVGFTTNSAVRMPQLSDSKVKIVSNQLNTCINLPSELIEYMDAGYPRHLELLARRALSTALTNLLGGVEFLGTKPEGIVVEAPSVSVKVVSSYFNHLRQLPKNRTAVVAIGSLVGHKGHQELWNSAIEYAAANSADPYLFVSNTVGPNDPIPVDLKLANWKAMYPHYCKQISTVNVEGGTLYSKVKHDLISPVAGLPPRYDRIVIFVGNDRSNMNMHTALMRSVNKFQGYEHVRVELVVTDRKTGISFTSLRYAARTLSSSESFDIWRDAFDIAISDATICSMIDTCKRLNKVAPS